MDSNDSPAGSITKRRLPGLSAWLKTNSDQLDHWERILRALSSTKRSQLQIT